LPIACFVFARLFGRLSERNWAICSVVSGLTPFLVFFLGRLNFLGFSDYAGLFGLQQSIGLTVTLIWLTLLTVYMLRAREQRRTANR
jgi:hypothetical protein